MINNNGYEYSLVINIKGTIKVKAHDEDEAIDKVEAFVDDLKDADFNADRWWWDAIERGDEALDIIREDE